METSDPLSRMREGKGEGEGMILLSPHFATTPTADTIPGTVVK